jgi:hypothetical protein
VTPAEHIAHCHARFMAAVRDGRRSDYAAAQEIVESVRKGSGDKAAEIAKREIWAFIRSGKNA